MLPEFRDAELYVLLALAIVIVLAIAGAELRVRNRARSGHLSIRSILRTLCGHRRHHRNDQDTPP